MGPRRDTNTSSGQTVTDDRTLRRVVGADLGADLVAAVIALIGSDGGRDAARRARRRPPLHGVARSLPQSATRDPAASWRTG
jgi:hypothetical protein